MNCTADNRTYLVPCLRHFAQIPFRGTSDTLVTLSDVLCDEVSIAPSREIPKGKWPIGLYLIDLNKHLN